MSPKLTRSVILLFLFWGLSACGSSKKADSPAADNTAKSNIPQTISFEIPESIKLKRKDSTQATSPKYKKPTITVK